jgi:hypothetical protein
VNLVKTPFCGNNSYETPSSLSIPTSPRNRSRCLFIITISFLRRISSLTAASVPGNSQDCDLGQNHKRRTRQHTSLGNHHLILLEG